MRTKKELDLLFGGFEKLEAPKYGVFVLPCDSEAGADKIADHSALNPHHVFAWHGVTDKGRILLATVLRVDLHPKLSPCDAYKALLRAFVSHCACDGCAELREQIDNGSLPVRQWQVAWAKPRRQRALLRDAQSMLAEMGRARAQTQ